MNLIVIDFALSKVVVYQNVTTDDPEDFLIQHGHDLDNCQWAYNMPIEFK